MTAQLGFLLAIAGASPGPAPPAASAARELDPGHRRLQGNQVGLDAFVGPIVGRAIGQSFVVGTRVTYYPIRHLGIGAVYTYSRGIGGVDTVDRHSVHFLHGQLELPLVSALRLGRNKVLQMDLFGEGGPGAVRIAGRWEALGAIGGGVRIYPRVPWLAIRVDALTYLHNTRRSTRTSFDTEVAFMVGLSVLLPSRSGI